MHTYVHTYARLEWKQVRSSAAHNLNQVGAEDNLAHAAAYCSHNNSYGSGLEYT